MGVEIKTALVNGKIRVSKIKEIKQLNFNKNAIEKNYDSNGGPNISYRIEANKMKEGY